MEASEPIDLPRPLESYFAFAELPANRQGRRFTITFPYFEGERLDRLQWWWQVSAAQERVEGEQGLVVRRREAVERFRQHIGRWLVSSRKRLFDGNPFPRLEVAEVPGSPATDEPMALQETVAPILGWVSNG